MSRRAPASMLLLAMMIAADPYTQPPRRCKTFIPEQPDYADYPEGKSIRIALPSGTLVGTVAKVTPGLLKLSCKPLGKVQKNQVLNVGSDTFTVKHVAMTSLLLRLEA